MNTKQVACVMGCMLAAAGCAETTRDKATPPQAATKVEATKAHDHSGWWCDEHGVPEAECSMCSRKVAAECKKNGDWCAKHDRAQSQCFLCDAGLEAKYAARYEAKYGKKPPVPTDNLPAPAKE
jgi:hypothetical protein